jgi:integrase
VRVRLKGLASVTKKLATGERRTYFYAWRGGPRLDGEPGSPRFIASYNAAIATKIAPPAGVLQGVLTKYQSSSAFTGLTPRGRADYTQHIVRIEKEFGDLPLTALADKRTRNVFLEWRDQRALTSARQADYGWTVLKAILNWALDRGLVTHNPATKGGKLYHGSRVNQVWTDVQEANFLSKAPKTMHLPLLLGLWIGARQGDLLRLTWSAYDGAFIRFTPSKTERKTGVRVTVAISGPLKMALDSTPKRSPLILTNADGQPWNKDAFQKAWARACKMAGVEGVTFHDLRGTAVTRLAKAGASHIEISQITGHSLKDVGRILEKHYLAHDPSIAASGIAKLEEHVRRTSMQTKRQTGENS